MATIQPVMKDIGSNCVRATWPNMAQGDDAAPVKLGGAADRSVQVEGTFDGVSVAIKGSIDETNFETLSDPTGTSLVFTAAKIEAITEATVQIKPELSGAGAATNVTVSLLVRSSK